MPLDCPRCNASLEEIELGNVFVDRCPRCAGIWFDNAEVGELTGLKPELKGFESIVPASGLDSAHMLCPRCDSVPLRRLSVPSSIGREVVFYRCASCLGTWLDRGELREIEDSRLEESLGTFFSTLK